MHADRLDQGRSALLERLGGDAMDDPKPREQGALPRLSVSQQTALLAELQPSLTLSQRRELATIGRGPAVEARALRLLRSRRRRRRARGGAANPWGGGRGRGPARGGRGEAGGGGAAGGAPAPGPCGGGGTRLSPGCWRTQARRYVPRRLSGLLSIRALRCSLSSSRCS